jgi:predicted ATP-binding protein involved in virulence
MALASPCSSYCLRFQRAFKRGKMSNFITEIKIGKVRHLENIDIILGNEKKHLILTGKNGSGKTSVLDALNIRLEADYYNAFFQERVDKYASQELKFILTDSNIEILLKNSLDNYIKKENNDFIYAYFGAKRELKTYKSKGIEKIDLLENKTKKLNNDFLQYIVNLKAERSFARDDNEEKIVEEIDKWFERFENILKAIYNDDSLSLKFDRRNIMSYNFVIEKENREVFDFHSLSDGYSSILDIITEILLKVETTKSRGLDVEGIVLIDEIETHLHVELQKNILPLLISFFPNIQFIVTTHSPFVLQSIENSIVYDLERKEQLSGKRLNIASYADIVKNYFEVDSEFSKVLENKIIRYEELIDSFEKNTLDIDGEKELLHLDIKLDEIAPMMSKNIFLRFKESQDRINDDGKS